MSPYLQLALWLIIWSVTWYFFNSKIKWRASREQKMYINNFIYFIIAALLTFTVYSQIIASVLAKITFAFILTVTLGYYLSTASLYRKRIKKGKYFLVSVVSDILFQQMMVYVAIILLLDLYSNSYTNYYFGFFFTIVHLPVIFLKWVKLRYFYLMLTFLGGTLFSYLIINFSFGIFYTFLIHYLIYLTILYFLQDDTKI